MFEPALRRAPRAVLAIGSLLAVGCAPVFSDLQSAKLVGRDRVEVTPSYTDVKLSDSSVADGTRSERVQSEWGVQVATGVRDRVDLRARYVYVAGTHVVGVGPKVSLLRDQVALHVPVGFAFGGGGDSGHSWQVHPTLLLTAPINRHLELNASAKALIPLSQGETLGAFNLGAGFGNLDRWVLRPEIGFLFNPGEEGHYTQFSVGLTVFGGAKRPTPPADAGTKGTNR